MTHIRIRARFTKAYGSIIQSTWDAKGNWSSLEATDSHITSRSLHQWWLGKTEHGLSLHCKFLLEEDYAGIIEDIEDGRRKTPVYQVLGFFWGGYMFSQRQQVSSWRKSSLDVRSKFSPNTQRAWSWKEMIHRTVLSFKGLKASLPKKELKLWPWTIVSSFSTASCG